MSVQGISLIVVEIHLLLRQCLISLMSSHAFDHIEGAASVEELECQLRSNESDPGVIILGCSYSAEAAISEAARLRRRLNSVKIVFLFRSLSSSDVQRVLTSAIDACIPLDASGEMLIKVVDLLSTDDLPVKIVGSPSEVAASRDERNSSTSLQLDGSATEDRNKHLLSISDVEARAVSLSTCDEHLMPEFSERECQILHGLTLGHANKLIARTYNITEATVKVHMKAILRKMNVANRTQAAIWAMQHDHLLHLESGVSRPNGGGEIKLDPLPSQ